MGDIVAGFAVGALLIVDGVTWKVSSLDGPLCRAEHETTVDGEGEVVPKTLAITLDAREVVAMGNGFFTLPGRIEKRSPRPGQFGVASVSARA